MQTLQQAFGQNLKYIRKAKGLTQDELATLTGNACRQIARIESGTSFPSGKLLENLCKMLHTSPQVLFNFPQNSYTHQSDFKIKRLGNFAKITPLKGVGHDELKIPIKNVPVFFASTSQKFKKTILVDFFEDKQQTKTEIFFPDGSSKLLLYNDFEKEIEKLIEQLISKSETMSPETLSIIRLALNSLECTQSRRRLIKELLKIEEKEQKKMRIF